MRVTVWGCRGSLATPGADTIRYGGNTSCVEVRLEDGTLLILDAGTGIRALGLALGGSDACKAHLLLTHLHLDHLEGLGFFGPLWNPATELDIWGPPSTVQTLEERVARYFSPPLFPVQLFDIPARITWHDVPHGPWEIASAQLQAGPVSHPGPTVGYRITEAGRSFAYLPDHEPALGLELDALPPEWISGFEVASGADVLFHDSQYTEDEYVSRVGWGHSSVADAVTFARKSGARRFFMFHHDPLHADTELESLLVRALELWSGEGDPPELAHEGMEITLAPVNGSRPVRSS
jgi:phosphoribosyl 1,2-cyclic phosphodiesterase